MSGALTFLETWRHRYLSAQPEVAEWYPCAPGQLAAHAGGRLANMPAQLAEDEIEEWMAWLSAHGAPEPVLENVRALGNEGTLCIVAGQQAGLFGGPLLALYKAAATVHAARLIAKQTGHRCVPVFWVASDDHDFAEVGAVNWLSSSGDPRSWTASPEPGKSGAPVFARPLSPILLDSFLAQFSEGEPETEYRAELLGFLRGLRQHPTGATWESQFVRCLVKWLGGLGVVPFAPRLGFARKRAAAVIERELQHPAATSQLVREAGKLLDGMGANGHTLHRRGDEANVFLEHEGIRCKITWDGSDLAVASHPSTGEELVRFSGGELLEHLHDFPTRFAPGAALRPVVQDAILPTAGTVVGPSELVYHAQIRDLYQHFGVFRPALLPRPGALLVDRRTERLMERLGLDATALVHSGPEGLKHHAAGTADEMDLRGRVESGLAQSTASIRALRDLLEAETRDTGLVKAAEKMAQAVSSGELKLRERLDQFLLRRTETVAGQVDRISHALWPMGQIQERWLGWLSPLLAQYGPDAPAWVAEQLSLDASRMQVVRLAAMDGGDKSEG